MIEHTTIRTEEDLNRHLRSMTHFNDIDFRESLHIVYTPIIFFYAAFDYVDIALQYCAKMKLPYKAECRIIKEQMMKYKATTFINVRSEIMGILNDKKDEFFDVSGNNLDKLWNLSRKKLSREYPELSPIELCLYTNMSLALLLVRRALRFEAACERKHKLMNCIDEEGVEIVTQLVRIQGKYKFDTSSFDHFLDAIERKIKIVTQVKINFT